VAVLHDLNLACRYATHLVAMKDGRVVAEGDPTRTVTEDLVRTIYDLECRVVPDPESGTPLVIPRRRSRGADRQPVAVTGAPEGETA